MDHSTQCKADADFSTTAVVRRRIHLAEAGRWAQLAQEALAERRERAWGESRPSTTADAAGDEGALMRAMQAAVLKACSGGLRSAVQSLVGDGKAASTDASRDKVLELVAPPISDAERAAIEQERTLCSQLWTEAPRITTRCVKRRARALRASAEPGPSGWRCSHIQALANFLGGAWELSRWSQKWAEGDVVRHETALWGSAVIAPIRRGETKVRPIALTEAMVKFAEGTALDCVATSLQAVLEPHQLSVRTAGAVEAMVRALRRWTRRWPDMTLVELDLSNAYGNALLCDASRHAAALPQHGRRFSSQLGSWR